MAEKTTVKPALVEIVVPVDNHTHKGELCNKGDKIEVGEETAEMLQKVWEKKD